MTPVRIRPGSARLGLAALLLSFGALSCHRTVAVQTPPPAPAPQPAPQPAAPPPGNVFVLLPEPDGKRSSVVVTNAGSTQTLTDAYQAVTIAGPGAAPTAPFPMDPAEVRRRFGTLLDALPPQEISFLLHFDEGSDALTAESRAQLNAVFDAIRDRRSTSISIVGHTDTTANSQFNYRLGLRRAEVVAAIFRQRGVAGTNIFVESHGDADLLVKTGRGVAERQNRRVEVIVR